MSRHNELVAAHLAAALIRNKPSAGLAAVDAVKIYLEVLSALTEQDKADVDPTKEFEGLPGFRMGR